MKKIYIIGLIALACLIIGYALAEKFTLSTYYPAPYGVYRQFTTTSKTTLATNPTATDPNAMVGIGTTSPEAILDVTSTNSAFLPPRMSTDERDGINPKVAGMMVYNNSNSTMEYWDGSEWKPAFVTMNAWDSGWFAINNGQNRIINHNLNSTAIIYKVYGATDSTGSNMMEINDAEWTEGYFRTTGYSIQEIGINSFRFIAGSSGYTFMNNSGNAQAPVSSRSFSYVRIIILKI